MLADFRSYIFQNALFTPKQSILLAVSGGIDSIVLFDLFLKSKVTFEVAHCNFGLRGKESDEEEAFVRKLCIKNNIAFHSKKFNPEHYAKKNALSTQMAARELRYAWFEKIRKDNKIDFIATAHHKTDVVETLLINLLRGTGIAGLHGIASKKAVLIRPLLFATRKQIEHYAKKNTLAFREDSSNQKDDYLRNKLRHWVLPMLEKINPDYENSFTSTAKKLSDIEKIAGDTIDLKREEIEEKLKNETRFSISELKKLNPLSLYLFEFLKVYHFTSSVIADIESCLDKAPGNQFFSATHRLLIDRDTLIISKLSDKILKGSFLITEAQKEQKIPIHLAIKSHRISAQFKINKARSMAQLDADKIKFPLEIRRWKSGDAFHPLGMKGEKKLSDFFIDNKLSIFEKEKIWLLCSAGKIVWIINYRIDDRVKVSSTTKKIIQIEYLEN
jgi:tRNA(Ile)-lysidine synthase